jgi:hypothetical protein
MPVDNGFLQVVVQRLLGASIRGRREDKAGVNVEHECEDAHRQPGGSPEGGALRRAKRFISHDPLNKPRVVSGGVKTDENRRFENPTAQMA